MGYTYAIQVTVGRELDVKARLVNMLNRIGNPGIIAIHALETFEQTLSGSGMSYRKWKAKVTGYIFVTVEHNNGLRMDAKCWQLIKRIPFVSKILDCYIQQEEWDNFFSKVDRIEPEIQIIEEKSEHHIDPDESLKTESEETHKTTLLETTENMLESGKKQMIVVFQKIITAKAVRHVLNESHTNAKIPFSLYNAILKNYRRDKSNMGKPMTVQNALHGLKSMLRVVSEWKN